MNQEYDWCPVVKCPDCGTKWSADDDDYECPGCQGAIKNSRGDFLGLAEESIL